jgi:hypothetical protein
MGTNRGTDFNLAAFDVAMSMPTENNGVTNEGRMASTATRGRLHGRPVLEWTPKVKQPAIARPVRGADRAPESGKEAIACMLDQRSTVLCEHRQYDPLVDLHQAPAGLLLNRA